MAVRCDLCDTDTVSFYRVEPHGLEKYYAARCIVHMKSAYFAPGLQGYGTSFTIISETAYLIYNVTST
jgi:hypothetical protein